MRRVIRHAVAVILLSGVLFIALVAVRRWTGFDGYDPYYIDYNQPGIDITSEGP